MFINVTSSAGILRSTKNAKISSWLPSLSIISQIPLVVWKSAVLDLSINEQDTNSKRPVLLFVSSCFFIDKNYQVVA